MRKAVPGFWLRHREQPRPLQWLVRRFYWVQIGLIALAVVAGLLLSASILKGLLIRTALEQEMAHYWQRVARDPAAPLPDKRMGPDTGTSVPVAPASSTGHLRAPDTDTSKPAGEAR